MSSRSEKKRIKWYRSPVDTKELAALNQRSDWKGFLQTFGHLGLLALTGAAAVYAAGRFPAAVVIALLFIHGTFYAFIVNGFHELCHKTVFENKFLNVMFRNIYSFLGWYNHVFFWASHQEHHKYTLHPPDDLEVMLPGDHSLKTYMLYAFVNPVALFRRLKIVIRLSVGRVEGEWERSLFPPEATEERQKLFNWARILLVGHGLIVGVSVYFGWWMIPVVITLAPFYGGWLQYLCNEAQHTGLPEHMDDYRINSRTIILSPFLQFLYWHMNYHIEHHMYAAVPCYNLKKLHDLIEDDLPYCPKGLIATWREIIPIVREQNKNPDYRYVPELP